MTKVANAQGCLLGLACGDALGRPVEFKSAAAIEAAYGTFFAPMSSKTSRKIRSLIDSTRMSGMSNSN